MLKLVVKSESAVVLRRCMEPFKIELSLLNKTRRMSGETWYLDCSSRRVVYSGSALRARDKNTTIKYRLEDNEFRSASHHLVCQSSFLSNERLKGMGRKLPSVVVCQNIPVQLSLRAAAVPREISNIRQDSAEWETDGQLIDTRKFRTISILTKLTLHW